jgi:signal transduction histidine kinase/GAF domain-containing protein
VAKEARKIIQILSSLSEIPLRCKDRVDALQRITDLGKQAMRSHACTLTYVNLEEGTLTQEACSGFDEKFKSHLRGKTIKLGSRATGSPLDSKLIARGEPIELYDLQSDGQGVASVKIARHYNLSAVLAHPLKLDGKLIGYFNHFSSDSTPFTQDQKQLLAIFARQAVLTIDKSESLSALESSQRIVHALSRSLLSVPLTEFLTLVSQNACKLLFVPVCIVWRLDQSERKLRVVAAEGNVDDEFKNIKLDINDPGQEHLKRGQVASLLDVTEKHPKYQHSLEAKQRGWVSLLTAPMRVEDQLIGMLDVYTQARRSFKPWEKESFGVFANYAAISIQQAESSTTLKRLAKHNQIIERMVDCRTLEELLENFLNLSLEMVGESHGWISQLNMKSGELAISACRGSASKARHLEIGSGITGRALQDETPIRADDVHDVQWQGVYEEFWPDTRSELAIPIMIPNAEVRIGKQVLRASMPIGVLNIESPHVRAFTKADEEILLSLSRHAAQVIARIDVHLKRDGLTKMERTLVGKHDMNDIMGVVLDAIVDTLGYEYVNVSLVQNGRIRSEYVRGIPENRINSFKRMADHPLSGDEIDIQADIVRTRQIEVPAVNDPRFDRKIFETFRHQDLVRVFIPMIDLYSDEVIGTVEAGHHQSMCRKHIFESDVQILNSFVEYATQAVRQSKRGMLDRIGHELRAPTVAIRSHASFLGKRYKELSDDKIQRKLDDIVTDSDLLLFQINELESHLGRTPPVSIRERTVFMRDIVVKAINQMKPLALKYGFEPSKIHYEPTDIGKIVIFIDRAKLTQVVFNLLTNSIKYAEPDLKTFSIRIGVDESKHEFVVRFKDWGIGVKPGLEEKIFEEGFRAPEAINKQVTGSGLGLSIARKIMLDLGGDLKLTNLFKPTEFQMILPKSLKEDPHDTLRR